MKRIISILLLTFLFTSCAGETHNSSNIVNSETETEIDTSSTEQAYRQITMDEAVSIMEKESGYVILDVRRVDEFSEGHIPNAINVANEDIGASDIPELPNKEQLILVYCRSGRRSKEAAEKLARLGYTAVYEFGGIIDWQGATEK